MAFVLSLFCLVLFFLLKNTSQKKAITRFVFFISIPLILYSGLRHETMGNDTMGYLYSFDNIQYDSWSKLLGDFFTRYLHQETNEEKDPGFPVFMKVFRLFSTDARAYLFAIAIIFYIALGTFVKRYAKTLRGILFFYIFYINIFNGYIPNSAIRQTLAITIVLFSYICFQNRNWKLFFALVIFASLFHKSALICLIVYPLSFIKSVDKAYYLGAPLFLLALVGVNQFAQFFLTGNDVYNGYLSGTYYGNTEKPFVILILMAGLYFVGLLGIKKDRFLMRNHLFYTGTTLSLLFSTLIWVNPSLIRIMAYFGPLMGILVSSSLDRIKHSNIIYNAILIIFMLSASRSIGTYYFMWEVVM